MGRCREYPLKLIQAADYDIERAQHDHALIDKITKKSENVSITRNVSGEGYSRRYLSFRGNDLFCSARRVERNILQQEQSIDTTNILFICGGAFDGLERSLRHVSTRNPLDLMPEVP